MKKTIISRSRALVILASAVIIPQTQAALIITNSDMEINTLTGSGDFKTTAPTDWIQATGVSGTVGVIGDTRTSVTDDTTAPEHFAWLHLQGINNEAGQSIGDITSNLGQTIRITYDLTRRTNEGTNWNHRVRLYAGDGTGYTAASDTADPNADLSDAFLAEVTGANSGAPANTFESKTVDVTLPSTYTGSLDQLYLSFKNRAGTTAQLHFDDVTVTVIPEPSSSALLGLGGLALILRRRK
ncbi:PEP-CTERM sorting domain-containing protein [Verrucomicrobiaceae bacterium N1E253]|uniref:PEP-CTERM sorting domain-containing protein n=1 Tax=Oceaniferula marina TaxID=2748318 RepID=A0A851GNE5_9BACT|nr:PEP-CTERM sorting domain-containing protein [Oceaniferula marina]NWK56557.1 PEP-CTERM sorting domain-containing protein [Oceaniferula marina]